MLNFINQRKKAGILAAALGISALVSGCGSSKPNNGNSGVPVIPPAIESPVETNNPDTGIIIEEPNSMEEFQEKYIEEAEQEVIELYEKNSIMTTPYWLDSELLAKEIAYAKALIEAYEKGLCPTSIEEEVELLIGFKEKDMGHVVSYSEAIGALNSLYNAVANMDSLPFSATVTKSFSGINALAPEVITELDDFAIKYYELAKIIHEACCDADHSTKNSLDYNYCSSLDEANKIMEENYNDIYKLRLTSK